ncbi:cytochrome P450 [Xylariaceae sp. FL0016]|nr:cytochrome P450 [Xylariaceae sp. FL0016]
MTSILLSACAGLLAAYAFLWALLHLSQDGREPLPVDITIPFISPIINMYRLGFKYYTTNSISPVNTVRLPGARLYVINSTALIPIVQRHTRVMSFSPILVALTTTMVGISKPGRDVAFYEPLENHGFALGVSRTIHESLAPGKRLDALNRRAIRCLADSLDHFASVGKPRTVKMYEWITHEVMMATTEGVYGPKNPYRNAQTRKAWLEFEPGLIPLLVGILPGLTARKSLKARDLLIKAYENYFTNEGHLDPETSAFTKARIDFSVQRGLSVSDMARMEASTSIGILANTLPATFWLVYHILSDPIVMEDCRKELSGARTTKNDTHEIDMAYIKTSCPILLSTFQEVFRYHGLGTSARMMMEDHMLDDQYLLKKGNVVLIPAAVQHRSQSAWGEDAAQFSHRRFVRGPGQKRHNPTAFRGFGGGSTLCPGRHFASTEILAFAAFIVLRFKFQPIKGDWEEPPVEHSNLATAMQKPDLDLEVEIGVQDDKRWIVTLSGTDKPMEVTAEDIEKTEVKDASAV